MYSPATFEVAFFMMIASTICWGSWANTYKATSGYRFELFYWDYAVGIIVISLIAAFTLGSSPHDQASFLDNVHSASTSNMIFAALGGFIFNIANVLLLAAIAMVGLAIAFPLSIGIALIEGVGLSYLIQPKGNGWLLTLGVALAVIAVILIGKAYGSLKRENSVSPRKGRWVCIISGILMGIFAPFDTRALTAGHPLTPYSIAVFFAIGCLICCFIFNVYLMRKPITGAPVNFGDYFKARPSQHMIGLAGGIIWGAGMIMNLVAANLVGMSISYAIGQASPMIAALWGLLAWHEFREAPGRSRFHLAGMFVCYVLALVLISLAYKYS
jgi:glucose uptake protein